MDATDSGLFVFRKYGFFVVDLYNRHRAHESLEGQTPIETPESKGVNFNPAGRNIVAGYTKHRWLHKCEFAMQCVQ